VAEYFIKNFKVDENRIYYSGNSMGSLLGYQTIGSRPDLWAAFMACNGLSHFGDITTEEGKRKFQEEIANVMTPFAKDKIAVIWQLGDEDEGASGPKGQLFYDFMYEYYKNEGLSNEDIDKILQINIYYEEDYVNNDVLNNDGTYNPHLATKLAYLIDKGNFMPWLLSQSK
jgi:predicted peptidase